MNLEGITPEKIVQQYLPDYDNRLQRCYNMWRNKGYRICGDSEMVKYDVNANDQIKIDFDNDAGHFSEALSVLLEQNKQIG